MTATAARADRPPITAHIREYVTSRPHEVIYGPDGNRFAVGVMEQVMLDLCNAVDAVHAGLESQLGDAERELGHARDAVERAERERNAMAEELERVVSERCDGHHCPVEATGDRLDGMTREALKAECCWWQSRSEELEAILGEASENPVRKGAWSGRDPVEHPQHYTFGGIECVDAIEAALGDDMFSGFLAGNVIKYVWRHRHKNGAEDLRKARWYLDRLIALVEGGDADEAR